MGNESIIKVIKEQGVSIMTKYIKLQEMILSILAYANFQGWDADEIIIKWLPSKGKIVISETKELSRPADKEQQALLILDLQKAENDKRGFIYCLKADNGLCKIGRAKSVDDRIKQINPKLPYDLELICSIEVLDYVVVENQLHQIFTDAGKHIRGEWFKLNEGDIDYIKSFSWRPS